MDAVAAIYAVHVRKGLGTFEEVAPAVEEMDERRRVVVGHALPYLVAEIAGEVRGFAYAAPFRTRSGYRFTAEDSVYVAPDALGMGLGRTLLASVISACEARGIRQLVALIGDSGNQASITLHERAGFERCGLLVGVGYKHGRWVDVVMMQRRLNGGDDAPPNETEGLQALE